MIPRLVLLAVLAVYFHLTNDPNGPLLGGAIGDIFLRLRADLGQFEADIEKAGKNAGKTLAGHIGSSLTKAGKSLQNAGKTLTTNLTLPIVGLGAAVFKVGSDFETTMNQIVGLAGVPKEAIGGIRDEILNMAEEIGQRPQELAEAFYFVASAGFEAEEAMEVLRVSAMGAASGLGQAQDVAKVLGLVINAYGKENITAARAADILVSAVKDGTAEADVFASVLGNVVPTAAQMGVTFDQVTAAIAGMTLSGVGAEEATTSLNQVLLSLLKPTTEAEEALTGMGLSSAELRRQLRDEGLLSVLRTLESRFEGNEEAAAQVFGNVRALRGALSLLGLDAEQLNEIFAGTETAMGDLMTAYGLTEGSARDYLRAQASIERLLIELSADVLPVVADILKEVAGAARALAGWWKSLSPETKAIVTRFAALVAVAGPLLFIVGKLTSGVGLLFGAFAKGKALLGPLVKLFGNLGVAQTAYLKALYAKDALGGGIASALDKVKGSSKVQAATGRLGKFMGSGLGKAFGIAFAAIAIFEVFATYDRLKKEHEAQLAEISGNVGNQLATGTTESLQQSKAALETGLAEINKVWDAGIFTTDSRKALEAQLAAVNAELERRASEMGPAAAAGIESGAGAIASAATALVNKAATTLDAGAAAAKDAGRTLGFAYAEGAMESEQAPADAWDRMLQIIKDALTPAAESARLAGRLASTALANAMNDSRPEVRAAAEATKQAMEDRLELLAANSGKISRKAATAIENGLKSKNHQVRKNSQDAQQAYLRGLEKYVANGGKLSREAAAAVASGLRSKNVAVKAAAERIRDIARSPLVQLKNSARTWGLSTGQAYAAGLRAAGVSIYLAAKAATSAGRKVLEAGSPPGPDSPLHKIDVWGERTGQAYADGLAKSGGAIRGTLQSLLAMPHSVPDLAMTGRFQAPRVGAVSSRTAGIVGADPAVLGGNTYHIPIEVQGALPVFDSKDLVGAMQRLGNSGALPSPVASPKYRLRDNR